MMLNIVSGLITGALLGVLLSGCNERDSKEVDHKLMCEPKTKQAYYVQPGLGQTSFVIRTPQADVMCQ